MLYRQAVHRALHGLASRGRARPTIEAYRADLRLYGAHVASVLQVEVATLTMAQCARVGVDGYLRYLQRERHNGVATVARRLAAVRALFAQTWRAAGLDHNPALRAAYPTGPRPSVRALSLHDARRVLRAAPLGCAAPLRDELIVRLLLENGLTLAEIVGLDCADVDLAGRRLWLRARARARRVVPLADSTCQRLRDHLGARRGGPLFCNRRGLRLSARGVQYVCTRAARRAGVPQGVSARSLRVTALALMRCAGASEQTIRCLLGLRPAG